MHSVYIGVVLSLMRQYADLVFHAAIAREDPHIHGPRALEFANYAMMIAQRCQGQDEALTRQALIEAQYAARAACAAIDVALDQQERSMDASPATPPPSDLPSTAA